MKLPPVYAIVDGDVVSRRGLDVVHATEELLEGGIRLLQLRWKQTFTREIYEHARMIAGLCTQAGARFVVNDRADIALLLGAGVHVGQDDLTPDEVRVVAGSSAFVGVSTHNESQFLAATKAPVDYIAVGPIYDTASKERPDPTVGPDELRRLCAMWNGPLVAIGGITRETAPCVWKAGADSVAVISDLYPEDGRVRQRAEDWMRIANEHAR